MHLPKTLVAAVIELHGRFRYRETRLVGGQWEQVDCHFLFVGQLSNGKRKTILQSQAFSLPDPKAPPSHVHTILDDLRCRAKRTGLLESIPSDDEPWFAYRYRFAKPDFHESSSPTQTTSSRQQEPSPSKQAQQIAPASPAGKPGAASDPMTLPRHVAHDKLTDTRRTIAAQHALSAKQHVPPDVIGAIIEMRYGGTLVYPSEPLPRKGSANVQLILTGVTDDGRQVELARSATFSLVSARRPSFPAMAALLELEDFAVNHGLTRLGQRQGDHWFTIRFVSREPSQAG